MTADSIRTSGTDRRERLIQLGIAVDDCDHVIALAGNPNTGKSTVFNALTGLRQHTGNWPGKTVTRAEGAFEFRSRRFKLVDLPGTYSLLTTSTDEEVARDFLLFGHPDVTVLVVDASRLERNLNLVLQVLEITDRVVVCLNLMDEARRHARIIEPDALSAQLGVPVVPTVARDGTGIPELIAAIAAVAGGEITPTPRQFQTEDAQLNQSVGTLMELIQRAFPDLPNARWVALRLLDGDPRVIEAVRRGELAAAESCDAELQPPGVYVGLEWERGNRVESRATDESTQAILDTALSMRREVGDYHDRVVAAIFATARDIASACVTDRSEGQGPNLDRLLDRVTTSRIWGFPLMLAMLAAVFWLTIAGANVPSAMLSTLLLDKGWAWLAGVFEALHAPWWLRGFLVDGVYVGLAWVVSVMLPPMAIFFPLFTLLEDSGYLPRIAFNLDRAFRACGAHGKQALTMCMGFGCNAAGVVACRVIDSPRERLIAIITNNFSLCNGRWPTQILIATIFIGALAPAGLASVAATAAVVGVALLGVGFSLLSSRTLSRTLLKGQASSFSLELPPYRPPRVWQVIYTSVIDRTLIVLWRAVVMAAPAGGIIWLVSNVHVHGASIAAHLAHWMDPVGALMGLNGVILLAYVVAIPANEIVIPTVLMLTATLTGSSLAQPGVMVEFDTARQTADVLIGMGGWTLLTGVNLMLFSLLHNPCSTTILTIWKETRSARWTLLATLMPLALGFTVTFVVAQVWRWMS